MHTALARDLGIEFPIIEVVTGTATGLTVTVEADAPGAG